MSKIKTQAIIFDQGNTLLMDPFTEVLKLKANTFRDIIKQYGLQIATKEIIYFWTKSNKEVNYPYISHFTQEEPIIKQTLKFLKIPLDISNSLAPKLLEEYRNGLKELIRKDQRTKEVKELLKKLKAKNKRLGVFSNDRISGLDMNLRYMGIKSYFEYIETSESIGIEKPDARVFDHILNYFKLPPSQVTYVGDETLRDIDPAKQKGLNAVLLSVNPKKYNAPWREYKVKSIQKPDAIINNLLDLVSIIE